MRIRNPWGHGEWNGKFADEDEAWDDQKGLKEKLGYTFANDGTWWMRYDDWCANYNKLYICKIFPNTWQQFSIHGEWKGNSAGGPYPPSVDRDEEEKGGHTSNDTNDKWFNNPQYRLTVHKKTQIIISLMQEDEKIAKKPYIPVNFLVVRVKSKRDRLWELDKDDIVVEASDDGQRFAQREIAKTIWLHPQHEKKNVHYIIVPNTETENKKEEERPFFLRVFASEQVELVQLPQPYEQQFQGKWDKNTAGGRRVMDNGKENQFWCRNPQYFLNLTKPTHLKIILRKKGGKRVRNMPIGLTITKAFPPTKPPATTIKPAQGKAMVDKTTTRRGMTTTSMKQTKAQVGDKIPELEPPKL